MKLKLTSLILLISIIGSCMKKPESKIDFGPEVQASEIDSAVEDALGPSIPEDIQLGEYLYYTINRKVNENATEELITGAKTVTFKDVMEINGKNYLTIKIVSQFNDYQQDPPKSWGEEETIPIKEVTFTPLEFLNPLKALNNQINKKDISFFGINPKLYPKEAEQEVKVTYHNLKVKREQIDPPEFVKNEENCGDVPNCKLLVTKLSYDAVVWENEETGSKRAYTLVISNETPYLSRVLENCYQDSVPIEQNGKVVAGALVRVCQTVEKFKYHE